MIILDGKKASEMRGEALRKRIESAGPLHLAVLLVGENPASELYVQRKRDACRKYGIECTIHTFDTDEIEKALLAVIDELNADESVTGILVQLPLPAGVDTRKILDRVLPAKDVDGLHSYHLTRILLQEEKIIPCTPKGVIDLLSEYSISLAGKDVCVVGFSDVVGKPLAILCLNQGATVAVCHAKTQDLRKHTLQADVVFSATGVAHLITADMIKEGAVVVDIGISRLDGKVVGDVAFESVAPKCSYITPVPGGVGPMTIISLIENLVLLHENRQEYL
jgi:methylenetetrahydrofolate dehydrogenase (NADP+) / methenyltetrahydrofolate cyclohydrolase